MWHKAVLLMAVAGTTSQHAMCPCLDLWLYLYWYRICVLSLCWTPAANPL
jgi:hypothetical protein